MERRRDFDDHRSRHSSRDHKRRRSRSRSGGHSRRPRSIKELREELARKRARKRNNHSNGSNQDIKPKSQFDVLPDPNAPPAAITQSLERAQETSAQTGVALSSVLGGPLAVPKHQRSLYIGGFDPARADEEEIFQFFNRTLNTVTGKNLDPVKSVYINKAKGFGFVELNDYNLTTACINHLNGLDFYGKSLQLRRPTQYDPNKAPVRFQFILLNFQPPGPEPEFDVTKVGLKAGRPSGFVENVPEKLYIAGIPPTVTDDQLQELLEAFGKLESMCTVRDKGYAFCLYKDRSVTDSACNGLNGLALGTQVLTVKRAELNTTKAAPGINLADAGAVAKLLPGSGGLEHALGLNPTASAGQPLAINGAPRPVITNYPFDRLQPTRVLVLSNMLTEEELADDEEYNDIVDDIRNECSKYGKVVSLFIPRPRSKGHRNDVGKVFVEYNAELEALTASQALQGRTFGERQVRCEFIEEREYRRKRQ